MNRVASSKLIMRALVGAGLLTVSACTTLGPDFETPDADLAHFEVRGNTDEWQPAVAKIEGKTVVISSPKVSVPIAVRYAWGAADDPNLQNAAGLPAPSFRTDEWDRETVER